MAAQEGREGRGCRSRLRCRLSFSTQPHANRTAEGRVRGGPVLPSIIVPARCSAHREQGRVKQSRASSTTAANEKGGGGGRGRGVGKGFSSAVVAGGRALERRRLQKHASGLAAPLLRSASFRKSKIYLGAGREGGEGGEEGGCCCVGVASVWRRVCWRPPENILTPLMGLPGTLAKRSGRLRPEVEGKMGEETQGSDKKKSHGLKTNCKFSSQQDRGIIKGRERDSRLER